MVDGEPRRGRFRRTRAAILTALAIHSAVELGGRAPSAEASSPAQDVFVYAQGGDVPTGIQIGPGREYRVAYEPNTGLATADYRRADLPYVDPGGYPKSIDRTIWQGCKIPDAPKDATYMTLLGKIGQRGKWFRIGRGGEFKAPKGGGPDRELHVKYNDEQKPGFDCTGDNDQINGPAHLLVRLG